MASAEIIIFADGACETNPGLRWNDAHPERDSAAKARKKKK